jgi:hypothetical protein
MMLELALKRSLFPSPFAQKGDDSTPPSGMKRIHWVGDKKPTPPEQDQGGKQKNVQPEKMQFRDARGYRELSSITLGDVNDAHKYFESQLLPSPFPAWLGANHFCMIDLVRKHGHPPAIFGRVKTCYPSDGYVDNIEVMELYFPHKEGAPDILLLHTEDIRHHPQKPVQNYCLRVKFLAAQEDITDFNGNENLFLEQGFRSEFETGFLDLLDIHERHKPTLPWMYVISSRWFAAIPESVRAEVREQLGKLIRWNKLIFNYHPEHLPNEVKSLNRELGLKAGFTDVSLFEPETPQQTAQIVASTFEKIFQQPMHSR